MGTTGLSLTLANSIIGVGILAMPFCFQQCGVLLATLILILMGLISRLCCYFLLKSALLARRRNFEFLAFQVFGSAGKFAVEVGIIGFLMGTCIAYFVVVGDLGPQIISKMFNINQSDILRTSIMVIVSLVCVLPLGLLRNVDSLGNVSAATIGFYFCLVIKVICEAASQLFSGDWHSKLDMWKPSGVLQCVPIFSMALFCQTQLFEVFESMPTLSLEKMNVVTKNAINICTSVYFTLGVFGYIAFGSQTISGNILMSLSPTMTSDVIKLGFVMSVAFSFPLIIFPCRASLYSLLFKKVHSTHHDHIINHSIPEATFRGITICIIGVALFISLLIPNIELVLGFVGSTIGVLICITFPAACFVNVTFKNTNERILAKGVVILGLVIMVLGTYANLQAADNIERYDERYITKERIDKIVEDFFEKNDKQDATLFKPIDPKHVLIKPIEVDTSQLDKDSVVQPPNPVPPESHSLEEKSARNLNIDINNGALKNIISNQNLQNNNALEGKVNQETMKELKPQIEQAIEMASTLLKTEAANVKEDIEKINKDPMVKADHKEIDMEHKQLIETIIQQNKEQRELMKEQKQILNKIKNEVASNEAKKIAVESIKQIANIAIESLNGVTDSPIVKNNNHETQAKPLKKLANEAVQEIAKKAVETIEAIKEHQEKIVKAPDLSHIKPIPPAGTVLQNTIPNIKPVEKSDPILPPKNVVRPDNKESANIEQANVIQNLVPSLNLPSSQNIPQQPEKVQEVIPQNIQSIAQNQQQNIQSKHEESNASFNLKPLAVNQNIPESKPNPKIDPIGKNIEQSQTVNKLPISNIPIANHLGDNVQNNVIKNKVVKAHSHSPDEPKSYIQGEDTQKEKSENKMNNDMLKVPLPVAMSSKSQVIQADSAVPVISNAPKNVNADSAVPVISNAPKNVNDIDVNKKVKSDSIASLKAQEPIVQMRSKRETKENCELNKIIHEKDDNKMYTEEILPKIDLGDINNKRLLHLHHIRSLKSVTETDKKR